MSVSLSALLAGAPALAAPVNNWTGFYAGLYAGGVFGRGKSSTNSDCTTPGTHNGVFCQTTDPDPSANVGAVNATGSNSVSSTKFTGGAQAGYNWQTGNIVYGVEADFGAFQIKGSRTSTGVFPVGSFGVGGGDHFVVANSFSTDWLLTTRGRIGWSAQNWLIYATAGLALTQVKLTNSYSDDGNGSGGTGPNVGSGSRSVTKGGWTIGTGLEVTVTRNWSVKGEYLYVDLGSVNVAASIGNPNAVGYAQGIGVSTSLTAHLARLGANFRF